ncbi:alpha/beta fold hydrolase [Thalassiella azotivora]
MRALHWPAGARQPERWAVRGPRTLTGAREPVTGPHLVVLPGLGLLRYLWPLARAVADRGTAVTVLDLPGTGHALACGPTVPEVGAAAGRWLRGPGAGAGGDLTLMGHSTGAQAALVAALAVQDDVPLRRLVLAGPTFAPTQRSLRRLAARVPAAYRDDSPRQLAVAPAALRGLGAVTRLVLDGRRDRPEVAVQRLTVPLLVTAGARDALAPRWWTAELARRAVRSPHARVVTLPGSHNNPHTHPAELAWLLTRPGPHR